MKERIQCNPSVIRWAMSSLGILVSFFIFLQFHPRFKFPWEGGCLIYLDWILCPTTGQGWSFKGNYDWQEQKVWLTNKRMGMLGRQKEQNYILPLWGSIPSPPHHTWIFRQNFKCLILIVKNTLRTIENTLVIVLSFKFRLSGWSSSVF